MDRVSQRSNHQAGYTRVPFGLVPERYSVSALAPEEGHDDARIELVDARDWLRAIGIEPGLLALAYASPSCKARLRKRFFPKRLRYKVIAGRRRCVLTFGEALDVAAELHVHSGTLEGRDLRGGLTFAGLTLKCGWQRGRSFIELLELGIQGCVQARADKLAGRPSLAQLMNAQYAAELAFSRSAA